MKVVIKSRGGGKTEELIKMSANSKGYIVCKDKSSVERIEKRAESLGLKIPQPLTYQELILKRYQGKGCKSLLIDDLEDFLEELTFVKIEAVSFSQSENENII